MSDQPIIDSPGAAPLSTSNTIVPRHAAAVIDTICAVVLGIMSAKTIGNQHPLLQTAALVGAYLGYYLFFEGAFHRTPGKLVAGLVVVGLDGRGCTWRQTLIRTGFRILEVNPVLLGGIPAALCIVASMNRQRLGDKVARTMVVRAVYVNRD